MTNKTFKKCFTKILRVKIVLGAAICFLGITIQAQQTQSSPSPIEPAKKHSTSRSDSTSNSSAAAKKVRKILEFKDTDKMFQILDKGKWFYDETDCKKAFSLKVSADRKIIKFIYPKSEDKDEREYIFNVSEVGSYYIRGQYESEKRLDDNNKPQVWDFVFLSNDEFIWHRSDWEGLSATKPVTRCNESGKNIQDKKTLDEYVYKVGQTWSYKTRPNEKESFFIVVKIDADEKFGKIIHIALSNLKMKNPNSSNEFYKSANHLPFIEEAITKSAVKILKEKVELPDYEEGYNLWKEAFDAKKAGVYTASIAEVIEIMEKGLNQ